MNEYKEINKVAWDIKTEVHVNAPFYNNEEFLAGASSLKPIEIDLLGDIKGKSILHLQCHFGQDSISLSKLGADVLGVDLSEKAIHYAQNMASALKVDTQFICCDIYDLPTVLHQQYDIVYTSYGVIGWLPDMAQWAEVISKFLKPGGHFVMVEFHPVAWMFDDLFESVVYSDFNEGEIVEALEGSYADRAATIEYSTITWNHSLSEVMNGLIQAGIHITQFNEYDYSPYDCFMGMFEKEKGQYQIKNVPGKLPLLFAITGTKV